MRQISLSLLVTSWLLTRVTCYAPHCPTAFRNSRAAATSSGTTRTALHASSILPAPSNAGTSRDDKSSQHGQPRGWRKIRTVFRRNKELQAIALPLGDATSVGRGGFSTYRSTKKLLPTGISPLFLIDEEDTRDLSKSLKAQQHGPLWSKATRAWAESALTSLLTRMGEAKNMHITCEPKSNVVDLARGHFRCDAVVEVEQMKFKAIQFSGGRISTQRLAMNLYAFGPIKKGPRFPNQFDFEADKVLFTEEDLIQSNCIRNGLARLLTRILKQERQHMRALSVHMEAMEILPGGKLSCSGHVKTGVADVPFCLRTRLGTGSRGHVLTFPGLELSLGPALGLFFPVPEVSLDLGHSAQIHKLHLDPARGVEISCRATMMPRHTLTLLQSYAQSTKSYAASYSVDVGRWLTRLGNFS
jgi:hypothetical protein